MYTQEAQELSDRMDRIDQKLDKLLLLMGAAPQAVPGAAPYTPPTSDLMADPRFEDVRRFIRRGQKIDAIKRHRELTGVGLKESKDAVEDLERRLGLAPPSTSW
jgi:ribosomal protein L7/L12